MSTSEHTKKWYKSTQNVQRVQAWRKRTKSRIVDAFGGECGICRYNKCNRALEFHHLDPSGKDFSLSSGNTMGWSTITTEMEKCIMVCSNCHREIHDGITSVPDNIVRFNPLFKEFYNKKTDVQMDECRCGNRKFVDHKYCSLKCFGQTTSKIDWTAVDLITLVETHNNIAKVGRMLGVSSTVVSRRYHNLKLKQLTVQ